MVEKILHEVRKEKRKSLDELEGGQILKEYGIPVASTILAKSEEEAIEISRKMEYPVVLKILSPDILHKSDAGCVKIGINSKEDLIKAYNEILKNGMKYDSNATIKGIIIQEMMPQGLELIFGIKKDPQFGHTIMFGLGGIYVEIFKDISLRLVPITRKDAYEMINETKVSQILQGARGKNYDINEVVDILLKLSNLVEEHSEIEEIDINPFILYEDGKKGKAVDALITLS